MVSYIIYFIVTLALTVFKITLHLTFMKRNRRICFGGIWAVIKAASSSQCVRDHTVYNKIGFGDTLLL